MPIFSPQNMTANNSPSPFVASASSSYTGFDAFRAFDSGKGANQYWVGVGTTGWLKIDIGAGNENSLLRYIVSANTIPEPNRMPKAWVVEGSNDDSAWDELDSQSDQASWGSGEERTFLPSAHTGDTYRYFRITVSENNGDDSYLVVAEWKLYDDAGSQKIFNVSAQAEYADAPKQKLFNVSAQAEFTDVPKQKLFNVSAQAEFTDVPKQKVYWVFAQAEYSETAAILVPKPDDLTLAMSIDGGLALVAHTPLQVQDLTLAMSIDDGLTLVPHEVIFQMMGRFFLLFD